MTESQLRGLGPALDRFLAPLLFCCRSTQTFEHLSTYCRGLLSVLPRKSAEPIALAAGTPEYVEDASRSPFILPPDFRLSMSSNQAWTV